MFSATMRIVVVNLCVLGFGLANCLMMPRNCRLPGLSASHLFAVVPGTEEAKASSSDDGSKAFAPPYTSRQLQEALDSLWQKDSDNPDLDARHIYGYGDPSHKLSMLQTITATRLLDYQSLLESSTSSLPSLDELAQEAKSFAFDHGAILNLQTVIQSQAPRMALAAEFKRASPSKGDIATHLNAGEQAVKYTKAGGANIISVLTESHWFKGSLDDMTQARLETSKGVSDDSRPAILRKDFVINEYMIAEAAAKGADTVLLIVAVLPQHVLTRLIGFSRSLGMEPLVEVHADTELDVAIKAGAKVIGVNNRNLHTFQMDLGTSERVARELEARGLSYAHNDPCAAYTVCALSGMSTAMDVDRYRQVGLGMCLIGESLMRATDPGQAIAALCLHPDDFAVRMARDGVGGAYTGGTQVVKVCGITSSEDALVACQAGANLIGVIFAPKSARKVTPEQAKAVVQAVRNFGERHQDHTFKPPNDESPLPHLVSCSRQLAEASRRPLVVGVFQNQDSSFVREMVDSCGLDLVQLHGQEGFAAAKVESCGVPAIRVVDIVVDSESGRAAENAVETILESITSDPIAILLDTAIKGQKEGGGTSRSFDWTIAEKVQAAGLPVIIAGGLSPENVKDAVAGTRPFGVDVSSGTEASPGRKDHQKVRDFVQNAKQAAVEANKGF